MKTGYSWRDGYPYGDPASYIMVMLGLMLVGSIFGLCYLAGELDRCESRCAQPTEAADGLRPKECPEGWKMVAEYHSGLWLNCQLDEGGKTTNRIIIRDHPADQDSITTIYR